MIAPSSHSEIPAPFSPPPPLSHDEAMKAISDYNVRNRSSCDESSPIIREVPCYSSDADVFMNHVWQLPSNDCHQLSLAAPIVITGSTTGETGTPLPTGRDSLIVVRPLSTSLLMTPQPILLLPSGTDATGALRKNTTSWIRMF